jgi:hypothetical protein
MMRKNLKVTDSKVLILGFTFKGACPPKARLPECKEGGSECQKYESNR